MTMVFLKPEFLYGLIALAIPIIIHLFHFRKAKKLAYSNVKLLQLVRKQTGRKRKLKHLLVLLCRMLAIGFLVIAFAQPFLPAEDDRLNAEKIDIYLDNSYSMSATDEQGVSLLDKGVQLTDRLISTLPEGTDYRLLTNEFLPESQYYTSGQAIRNRLTTIEYSGIGREPQEVIGRLDQDIAEGNVRRYWISDFQQDNENELQQVLDADSTVAYNLFPMQYGEQANVYVDSIYLSEPVLFQDDRAAKLMARFASTADEAISGMPVQLLLNGQQVAVQNIDLPAEGTTTVNFVLPYELERINEGEISFEDFPVSFDNSFYFVLRKAATVKIAHVYGADASGLIPSVYDNKQLFLLESYQQENVPYSELLEADLLVLEGVRAPSASLLQAIGEYANSGKRITFIPAKESNTWWPISGLRLKPQETNSLLRIEPPEEENPFYTQVFEEQVQEGSMPQAKPVISWQGRFQQILQLSSGQPFFSLSDNRFLLASPLHEAYTDFGRHALFVPSMYKLAFGSLAAEAPLYIETGTSSLRFVSDSLAADQVYRLVKGDLQLIPGQRVAGRQLYLDLPAYALSPGIYRLTTEDTLKALNQLAVNFSTKESQLSQLPADRLGQLADKLAHVSVLEADELLNVARAQLYTNFRGEALWKWAVLVVLLSLLAEILIIRFWK